MAQEPVRAARVLNMSHVEHTVTKTGPVSLRRAGRQYSVFFFADHISCLRATLRVESSMMCYRLYFRCLFSIERTALTTVASRTRVSDCGSSMALLLYYCAFVTHLQSHKPVVCVCCTHRGKGFKVTNIYISIYIRRVLCSCSCLPLNCSFAQYRSRRAKLAWLAHTHPDICYAVSIAARVTEKVIIFNQGHCLVEPPDPQAA